LLQLICRVGEITYYGVFMEKIIVELVQYDTEKTKKRKRANFLVENKSEESLIEKLEKIHKGDKVKEIFKIVWGEEKETKKKNVTVSTGWIKFFEVEKGFGFIAREDDMDDLFFHASALGGEKVFDEDYVEFEVSEGPKGPIAIHIKVIDKD
jgi:CspA family cold shock protein